MLLKGLDFLSVFSSISSLSTLIFEGFIYGACTFYLTILMLLILIVTVK